MGLVVLLLVLALLLGGVGLAAHALWWMLIIAAALVIASAFTGFRRRSIPASPSRCSSTATLSASAHRGGSSNSATRASHTCS